MRIIGNSSVERLDVSDSLESPHPAKTKKRAVEYVTSKIAKNEDRYQASLFHLKCGLVLYLVASIAKLVFLLILQRDITPFVCEEMDLFFIWDIIESGIGIFSVFLSLLAIKFGTIGMYEKFLAFLVINISLKVLMASYALSFLSSYVTMCLQVNKEVIYSVLAVDFIIFLYFLYNGVRLRKFLSENKAYVQTINVPLVSNKIELVEI